MLYDLPTFGPDAAAGLLTVTCLRGRRKPPTVASQTASGDKVMTERGAARSDLVQVLGRFPKTTLLIRQLFLADQGFRGLCEEYALARDTLTRFQAMPNTQRRPEIDEYLTIIAELENEMIMLIRDAGGCIDRDV